MIDKILIGKNKESKVRLEKLAKTLGAAPNLLWYPSAGKDFRDIIELLPQRDSLRKLEVLPDLFIHTDYMPDWSNDEWLHLDNVLYSDNRTKISIVKKFEFALIPSVRYNVDKNFITGPNNTADEPIVYLLDVFVESQSLGNHHKAILYFLFENTNFLDEVLLKNKIHISLIVKTCEGCGFGGSNKSISVAYAFLSILQTKYLLIDSEEHTDFSLVNKLKDKYLVNLKSYKLSKNEGKYRGMDIYKVTIENHDLTDNIFENILTQITSRN